MEQRLSMLSTLFRLSLWFKIVYGISKCILAFALLGLIQINASGFFYTLMSHELAEDPNDLFAAAIGPLLEYLSSGSTYFPAFYLLFWGFVDDIFLSVNLLREKLWAYKVALVVIGLFVLYEIYRFSHARSIILAFVIVIDLFVLWFIRREQKRVTRV